MSDPTTAAQAMLGMPVKVQDGERGRVDRVLYDTDVNRIKYGIRMDAGGMRWLFRDEFEAA